MPAARITGGTLAGRVVRAPGRGRIGFRPTSARLREALFGVIGARIEEARFLDLYAGAGLVGLDALSRGAAEAVFIESSNALAGSIREHVKLFGLDSVARVVQCRLPKCLEQAGGPFSIIFLDPPYDDATASRTLEAVAQVATAEALVVYEHSSRYNPPERPAGLHIVERRVYGDSAIGLYEITESA